MFRAEWYKDWYKNWKLIVGLILFFCCVFIINQCIQEVVEKADKEIKVIQERERLEQEHLRLKIEKMKRESK